MGSEKGKQLCETNMPPLRIWALRPCTLSPPGGHRLVLTCPEGRELALCECRPCGLWKDLTQHVFSSPICNLPPSISYVSALLLAHAPSFPRWSQALAGPRHRGGELSGAGLFRQQMMMLSSHALRRNRRNFWDSQGAAGPRGAKGIIGALLCPRASLLPG